MAVVSDTAFEDMIGEIIPQIYDVEGKPVGAPVSGKRKRLFHKTFPMGRYVSQPLSRQWRDLKELRRFLRGCKYVSDKEQFNRGDYWMPPEEFEQGRKGDCDDFSLYTWRQLLGMGYKARYVVGRMGKYGECHAWVTIEKEGKFYLVKPLAPFLVDALPRLSVARYQPTGSVEWDGRELHYFVHEKRDFKIPVGMIPVLVCEWLLCWVPFWYCLCCRILLSPFAYVLRKVTGA